MSQWPNTGFHANPSSPRRRDHSQFPEQDISSSSSSIPAPPALISAFASTQPQTGNATAYQEQTAQEQDNRNKMAKAVLLDQTVSHNTGWPSRFATEPMSQAQLEYSLSKGFAPTVTQSMISSSTLPETMYSPVTEAYWYGLSLPMGLVQQRAEDMEGSLEPNRSNQEIGSFQVHTDSKFPTAMSWERTSSGTPPNSGSPELSHLPEAPAWSARLVTNRPFADGSRQRPFSEMTPPSTILRSSLPAGQDVDTFNLHPDSQPQRRGSSASTAAASDQATRRRWSKRSSRASSAQKDKRSKSIPSTYPSSRKSPIYPQKTADKSSDRSAHNDIERKYRMNLKDKIAELRAAIPSLQNLSDGESDNGTGAASSKVSKGMVLTKATEYIRELEQANKTMAIERYHLIQGVQDLESLLQDCRPVPSPHSQFLEEQNLDPFHPGRLA